jgi:hypothetical protein
MLRRRRDRRRARALAQVLSTLDDAAAASHARAHRAPPVLADAAHRRRSLVIGASRHAA